jgi:hypothetical protein
VIPGSGTKSVAVYRAEKEEKMNRPLPSTSAFTHPVTDDLIFVMKGRTGYWPASALGVVDDTLTADKWNAAHGITKGEAEAMFSGSAFGWEVPAAKSETYTDDGLYILPRKDDRSIV